MSTMVITGSRDHNEIAAKTKLQLFLKARKIEKARLRYENEKLIAIDISKGAKYKLTLQQRIRRKKLWFKKQVAKYFAKLLSVPKRSWCYKKLVAIRTDGTLENYMVKSFFGFVSGILLTYMFFVFFAFQLNFKLSSATILCTVLGVLLTLGLAFSYRIRCIVLLLLPQFCSKRGRQALMAYAFVLALSGPMKNILHNTGALTESLACAQEQLKEAVKTVVDLVKQPYYALRNAVSKVIKSVKGVVKKIRETLVAIKRIVLSILKVITSVFQWLGSVINICNKKLGTPFDRCQGVFDGAVADCKAKLGPYFGVVCNITYIVSTLCYVVKPFDFICMLVSYVADTVVGAVRDKIKKFIMHMKAMFYVKVKFSHSFHFETNQSKSIEEVSRGIATEIRSRTDGLFGFFDWLGLFTSLFTFVVVLKVLRYRYKWLTSERFDNRYITDELRTIDLIRARQNKETVLPLNPREKNKYVPLSSVMLIKPERIKLARSLTFLSMATVKLSAYMTIDYSLYWLLNIIQIYGRFEGKVERPTVVSIHVSGDGYLADLYRSIVKSFTPQGKDTEVNTMLCLPEPVTPNYDKYTQIITLIVFCWLIAILEPYCLRLRQVVMCQYYPDRAKQRAVWLYNHIIRSRGSFLKFARRQLRRKYGVGDGEKIEKVTLKERLWATCPCLNIFFPMKQKVCLLCGAVEVEKNPHIKCPTPGCVGLFCSQCFAELQNLCTICRSPMDYGDLSDMSEEKDSSDDQLPATKVNPAKSAEAEETPLLQNEEETLEEAEEMEEKEPIEEEDELAEEEEERVGEEQKLVKEEQNPVKKEQNSVNKEQNSVNKEQNPVNKEQNPVNKEQNPVNKEQNPVNKEQNPVNEEQNPVNEEQNPVNKEQNPVNEEQNPVNEEQNPVNKEQNPVIEEQNPVNKEQNPMNKRQNPMNKGQNSVNKGQNPVKKGQNPANKGQNPVKIEQNPVKKGQNPVKKGQNPANKRQKLVREEEETVGAEEEKVTKKEQFEKDVTQQTNDKYVEESDANSESSYSYTYQDESPQEDEIVEKRREPFKDLEAQRIRDDVTIQIFNESFVKDSSSSCESPSCFVVRARRRIRARLKKRSSRSIVRQKDSDSSSTSIADTESWSTEEVDEEEMIHIEMEDSSEELLPRESRDKKKRGRINRIVGAVARIPWLGRGEDDKKARGLQRKRPSLMNRIVGMLHKGQSMPVQSYRRSRKTKDTSSSSSGDDENETLLKAGDHVTDNRHLTRRRVKARPTDEVDEAKNLNLKYPCEKRFATKRLPKYLESAVRRTSYMEVDETEDSRSAQKSLRRVEDINELSSTRTGSDVQKRDAWNITMEDDELMGTCSCTSTNILETTANRDTLRMSTISEHTEDKETRTEFMGSETATTVFKSETDTTDEAESIKASRKPDECKATVKRFDESDDLSEYQESEDFTTRDEERKELGEEATTIQKRTKRTFVAQQGTKKEESVKKVEEEIPTNASASSMYDPLGDSSERMQRTAGRSEQEPRTIDQATDLPDRDRSTQTEFDKLDRRTGEAADTTDTRKTFKESGKESKFKQLIKAGTRRKRHTEKEKRRKRYKEEDRVKHGVSKKGKRSYSEKSTLTDDQDLYTLQFEDEKLPPEPRQQYTTHVKREERYSGRSDRPPLEFQQSENWESQENAYSPYDSHTSGSHKGYPAVREYRMQPLRGDESPCRCRSGTYKTGVPLHSEATKQEFQMPVVKRYLPEESKQHDRIRLIREREVRMRGGATSARSAASISTCAKMEAPRTDRSIACDYLTTDKLGDEEDTLPYQATQAYKKVLREFHTRSRRSKSHDRSESIPLIHMSKRADSSKQVEMLYPPRDRSRKRSDAVKRFARRIIGPFKTVPYENREHNTPAARVTAKRKGDTYGECSCEPEIFVEASSVCDCSERTSRYNVLTSTDETTDNNESAR